MYWKVILNQATGAVELCQNELVLSRREWQEARNTSQEILSALQEMKSEQGIEWSDVPELRLELDLPPHATARRIAETFEKMYSTFVA